MKRKEIISLLTRVWFNLEHQLNKHPVFCDDEGSKKRISWGAKSAIRKMGSEAFLQALFFSELNKLTNNHLSNDLIISVEGKKLKEKRPDILAWSYKLGQNKPFLVIELKVTGSDLIESNFKNEGIFLDEIKKYSKNDLLQKGKIIFFFCCYYESMPDDIYNIVSQYGSLLKWIIKDKEINFPKQFINSVIEGYGFRGDYRWLIIDNQVTSDNK